MILLLLLNPFACGFSPCLFLTGAGVCKQCLSGQRAATVAHTITWLYYTCAAAYTKRGFDDTKTTSPLILPMCNLVLPPHQLSVALFIYMLFVTKGDKCIKAVPF